MERHVKDIPTMYSELMILMFMCGEEEDSRNGKVLTLQQPLTVTVADPTMRQLTDPVRHANPFFHVMEFIWMMSGSDRPDWITQFNSRFHEYADTNNPGGVPIIHGAYGHRWREHFNTDQLFEAVRMLVCDPESRRVVLSMWDANVDLGTEHNDLPCNTHIYLRIVREKLEMTVCNRSNDVIWGMTGANAVHMTMLQELLALELGYEIGCYRVFTNNAHIYTELPRVDRMLATRYPTYQSYEENEHTPLLTDREHLHHFISDSVEFVRGRRDNFRCGWFEKVAYPMREIYLSRRAVGGDEPHKWLRACEQIEDDRWRLACIAWLQQKS